MVCTAIWRLQKALGNVSESRPSFPNAERNMASPARFVDSRDRSKPIHPDSIRAGEPDPTMDRLMAALRERLDIAPQVEPTLGGALRHLLKHAGGMVRPRIVYRLAGAYGI